MASGDRKQALLIMMRELLAKTDEEHSLNATELGKILESEGCPVDRRTIYANIEALENFGLDIIKKEGSTGGYYIGSREFELPELKLLVDAVQASRFITEKKSAELIRSRIPGSTLTVLPGLHHGEFSINHADDYAQTVRELADS